MGFLFGGGGRMRSAGFISARSGALTSTEPEFRGVGIPEVSSRKAPRTSELLPPHQETPSTPTSLQPRDSEAHLPSVGVAPSDLGVGVGTRSTKFLLIVTLIQKLPKSSLIFLGTFMAQFITGYV